MREHFPIINNLKVYAFCRVEIKIKKHKTSKLKPSQRYEKNRMD